MKPFTQTLTGALDQGTDGETRRWVNPESKAEGEIVQKPFGHGYATVDRNH